MLNRLQFDARVDDQGDLVPASPALMRHQLGRWKGRTALVTVEVDRKRRSLKANAYLWGVVYRAIAEWSGYTVDEVHEVMKALHLPKREVVLPTGELLSVTGSTAALDSGPFTEYVALCKRWAAEQGLYVPEPDEW